jgi:hypothetical protein
VTERALRDLRAAQAVEHRHLGAEVVGDAVSLDTMWVGNLKGEGKVWQYTTSTAAASRSPGSPLGTGGSFVAGVVVGQVQQAHRLLDMLEPV